MNIRSAFRFLAFGLAALIVIASMTAVAATNTVPPTRVTDQVISFNINHLEPSVCSGINAANLITGSGTLIGTDGNDLILASSSADTIDGLAGNDCILGGGGDDSITGGDGNDICLGGPDNDAFTACEGEVQ